MKFTAEFDRYLNLFRLRLRQLQLARGAAALAIVALVVTSVAVTLAIRNGFPDDLVIAARLILFGGLAATVWLLVVRPGRRLLHGGAAQIEARTPSFGGRVETYIEMTDSGNPMRDLLAENTLKLAANHAPERQVRQKEFTLALSAAGIALIGLLFLAIAGPGNYAYGVRHLWFGWVVPDLLPPQSIDVTPGDDGIRQGGTVAVRARMQGFAPAEAFVHARFGDGEWQQVAMLDDQDAFEFTFFSVREPLEYFVSAANVRSPAYTVRVVDLPVVENLIVTYHYPDWTGLEPETRDPGGDVRAIAETEVEVRIQADRQMSPGELVVDEQAIDMRIDGDTATATFKVQKDGQYFVAAKVGGEQIRLTDDYFITLLADELPQIEFARPGRDWSASSVEEVTARISASDDFGIESLELRYSVNGGRWESIELPVDPSQTEADHVFFLESLSQTGPGNPLVPGDLISYFAVASDRANSARTDIFFIDVQPFDRRYSQSQQMGGAGGQQGGQQEREISQRQKEIIVSTWNLIREQQEQRRDDPAYVSDNAALLSRVQATLREQVETLSLRTQARQLDASAEEIAEFVDNLDRAAEAMIPAAERLGEIDLEQAILPEQEALQHLLAAEAVFRDISVSLQANNRGGGGQAGRDLTEMFELEMDLEKNQYETGSRATPEAPQQQLEEAANELEELARRQEQLARNLNQSRQPTAAQRWQQEMLRRDVEELRDRLERMQQQNSSGQAQNQQAQNQQAQDGRQSSAGQSAGQTPSPGEQQQRNELQRRLESAIRAMNEADAAMQNGDSPDELRRAAGEAQRQLDGARDSAIEEQQQAMQAALEDLSERADRLYDTQSAMDDRLQEAIRGVSVGRNNFERLDSGMTIDEEYAMAAEKRRLQAEVQKLQQDARNTAAQIDDVQPGAAETLREATENLQEMQVETRISVAAEYIEQGEAVYVAASESAVTEALRQLAEDLQRAEGMLGNGGGEQRGAGNQIAETLAEIQQLRRGLQQASDGTATGGPVRSGIRDDRPESTGQFVDDLQIAREFDRQADNISEDVLNMYRALREAGVSVREFDELRRLATDVRAADFTGNPELLEAEARRALDLVLQLEIAVAKTARKSDRGVRSNVGEDVPDEHREIVADYYRRLGQADNTSNR
jgi:hypothetical protein